MYSYMRISIRENLDYITSSNRSRPGMVVDSTKAFMTTWISPCLYPYQDLDQGDYLPMIVIGFILDLHYKKGERGGFRDTSLCIQNGLKRSNRCCYPDVSLCIKCSHMHLRLDRCTFISDPWVRISTRHLFSKDNRYPWTAVLDC